MKERIREFVEAHIGASCVATILMMGVFTTWLDF